MTRDGASHPKSTWADAQILVVALGGNAITRAGDEPSVGAQFKRTRETAELLVPIVASGGYRLVITHGNGPQVGNILLRSDVAEEAGVLPRLPIDSAVADTQGAMGYMIQQCLANALWESGIHLPVVTIVTQVIVDEEDPAFSDPSKPVGRYYSDDAAERARGDHGWVMKRDPQGRGWRRVVPSPAPREIVEQDAISELLDEGVIVVACGGGGIPVIAGSGGSLQGVDAVIDKDLASSLLANNVRAEIFAIATEVDNIFINYGKPDQTALTAVDVDELAAFQEANHFAPGSMSPKVDAVIAYLRRGGRRAIVTSPESLEGALSGRLGTHVTRADLQAGKKTR
jgi:carbamate kinase